MHIIWFGMILYNLYCSIISTSTPLSIFCTYSSTAVANEFPVSGISIGVDWRLQD